MKKFLTAIIFALAFVATPAGAFTMDAQGGFCNRVSSMGDFNMSFYGHLWYPIDQMVFAGLGVGYEELDNVGMFPFLEASGFASRLVVLCCRLLQVISATCSARMIRCSGALAADSTSRMVTAHQSSFRRVTSS